MSCFKRILLRMSWEFWKNNLPFSKDAPCDVRSFFDSIVNTHKKIPLDYLIGVFSAYEAFLIEKGDSSALFVRDLYSKTIGSKDSKSLNIIHALLLPAIKKQPQHLDMRQVVLRSLNRISRLACRQYEVAMVNETKDKEIFSSVFLVGLRHNRRVMPIPADTELFVCDTIRVLPCIINLPEYEQVTIISDARPIGRIAADVPLWPENAVPQAGIVRIRKYSFGDFLNHNGITIPALDSRALNVEVMEVLDDYFSEKKNRIILHKGCIYGAPQNLFKVTYSEMKMTNPWEVIARAMRAIENDGAASKNLNSLHEEFLRQADSKCIFLYDKQTDTITLNGKYFIRNVPAKILAKMIKHYVECGCHGGIEIERKSLLNDPEIVPDRNNPNLERRFKLIAEAFRKKCPGCCCFSRPSKGVIKLEPKLHITFEER